MGLRQRAGTSRFLSDEERLGVFFVSVLTNVGRMTFCNQSRVDLPRFRVRLQEVAVNRHKDESNEREGKVLGHEESWGVGDLSGFTKPSS